MNLESQDNPERLKFYGGIAGILLPFLIFITGVITIALSGAPDERGFWPILILALGVGLSLAKDKTAFSETVINGMSQKIVMIMITAWMLASIVGVLMTKTGLVEGLIWLAIQIDLGPSGFVLSTFIICCIVSLSTGSSFATILICSPLLYPSGGLLGVHLPLLAGAILAGATFGDFTAPISDTTIASTLSQKAAIGPTVKSRLKYVLPVLFFAALVYMAFQFLNKNEPIQQSNLTGSPDGLPMLIVPIVIIYLFLKGKHLLHGLLVGLFSGIFVGVVFGLLPMDQILSLDLENFRATSFVIDGINRAVGISFFTILLLGLVSTIKASGIVDNIVSFAADRSKTRIAAEGWIAGATGIAVLLTTHSIVAILMVTEFVSKTGEQLDITNIRRANIMSLVTCFFPFVLPYFIPVILMANMTSSGTEFGIPQSSPLEIGLYNFVAWGLLVVLIITVGTGLGKEKKLNAKDD